jgi:putative hydrolase of the HAD superfamily
VNSEIFGDAGSQATRVRAVLFDYGGVLAEEGFRHGLYAIAQRNGIDPVSFYRAARDTAYQRGYFTGHENEAGFWRQVRESWKIRGRDRALTDEILRRYVLRPDMLEIVGALKSQCYLTAILSDHGDWLDRLETRDTFYGKFDRVFVSYRLGKTKRDASLFGDVVHAIGIPPQAVLLASGQ